MARKRRGTIEAVEFELTNDSRSDDYATTYTIGRRTIPIQFENRRLVTRDSELIAWLDTASFCKRV